MHTDAGTDADTEAGATGGGAGADIVRVGGMCAFNYTLYKKCGCRVVAVVRSNCYKLLQNCRIL